MWHAYDNVQHNHTLTVESILDVRRCSQLVRVVDRSPLAMVNRVGQPRMVLSTFVSFPASHAYRDDGSRLIWNICVQHLMKPNAYECERAMEFPSSTTMTL